MCPSADDNRDGPSSGSVKPGDRTVTDERSNPGEPVAADRDLRDESIQIADTERRRNSGPLSGLLAAIGLWVAFSVFLTTVSEAIFWNNVLVGTAIFLAAGYNYYRVSNDEPVHIGVTTLVALLGLWLLVAPPLFTMSPGPFWSTFASGLLIVTIAGYNAYGSWSAHRTTNAGLES